MSLEKKTVNTRRKAEPLGLRGEGRREGRLEKNRPSAPAQRSGGSAWTASTSARQGREKGREGSFWRNGNTKFPTPVTKFGFTKKNEVRGKDFFVAGEGSEKESLSSSFAILWALDAALPRRVAANSAKGRGRDLTQNATRRKAKQRNAGMAGATPGIATTRPEKFGKSFKRASIRKKPKPSRKYRFLSLYGRVGAAGGPVAKQHWGRHKFRKWGRVRRGRWRESRIDYVPNEETANNGLWDRLAKRNSRPNAYRPVPVKGGSWIPKKQREGETTVGHSDGSRTEVRFSKRPLYLVLMPIGEKKRDFHPHFFRFSAQSAGGEAQNKATMR